MHRRIPKHISLLSEETLVESKLLTLENVSVTTTTLAGTGRNDGKETTCLELLFKGVLDLSRSFETLSLLLLNTVGLLLLLLFAGLGLSPTAQGLAIVGLEPLSERSGVNLDNGGLGECVGTDKLVVRRMVDDTDHTGLLSDTFRAPGEVARVQTESTELAVAATGADKMDTLSANTGIGRLATLLESPKVMSDMTVEAIGLCIPLLAVVCALRTRGRALVTRIARDTGEVSNQDGINGLENIDTP